MAQPQAADWDAQRYHRVAQPHAAWGANVLDRLVLRGDEVVLDAGCGSGKVTSQLLQRLTRGSVVALDLSPAMLAEARLTLEVFAPRVRFVQANLLEVDQVVEPSSVDAIFSTATFHWIEDHARLFRGLRHVSRPGARLVAQYGGGDNLAEFMRAADSVAAEPAYAAHLSGKALWRFYFSPDQDRAHLEAAGFAAIEAWLEPSPQTFGDADQLADFGRAVVLRNHLAALPPPLQDPFVAEVVEAIKARLGGYVLDYVRLNVDATAA